MAETEVQTRPLTTFIRTACVLEARAKKPGNVHPEAPFEDACYADFVRSAVVVAPIVAQARTVGIGQTILSAVEATHDAVGFNTNLGIVLLLAPLAAVADEAPLASGIGDVLRGLTVRDAELAYAAIRTAQPGGLNRVSRQDVAALPSETLLECMRLAADRDLIARQYATDFSIVLSDSVKVLTANDFAADPESAIIRLQLTLMSRHPDSLIARKCGQAEADESARRAADVLSRGWPESGSARKDLDEFDTWLRASGNARNPGATADLIAAALFASFRDGHLPCPSISAD